MLGSTFSDLGCSHLDTYPWCMRGRGSRLEGCLERLSDPHYLASALSQCVLNKRLRLRLLFCWVPGAKHSAGLSHSHPSWSRRGLIAKGAKGSRAWGFNLLVVTKLHNPGSASTPWVPSRFSQWLLGSLFYERLPFLAEKWRPGVSWDDKQAETKTNTKIRMVLLGNHLMKNQCIPNNYIAHWEMNPGTFFIKT